MPTEKISITVPSELMTRIEETGDNRSQLISRIIARYFALIDAPIPFTMDEKRRMRIALGLPDNPKYPQYPDDIETLRGSLVFWITKQRPELKQRIEKLTGEQVLQLLATLEG